MKNTQTKSQKIASCVTHTKEAHLTDQTDQLDPGTDIPTSGPTRQTHEERRWPGVPRWDQPNPWFGRTCPGSRPGAFWREASSDPPEGGFKCFHISCLLRLDDPGKDISPLCFRACLSTCNTRFIKGHKPSNHIRARIKSHVYTTE